MREATPPSTSPCLLLALAVLALSPRAALAQDLMALLEDGPVVMVQQDEEGGFDECTAIVFVEAPPAAVWEVLADLESHPEFMPKLRRAEVKERSDDRLVVALELETPGRNTRYVMAYDLRPAAWRIDVSWVSGDLRGTFGTWRLVPSGQGTLVYYQGATRNYSRILQRLEDDQQTITIGVNVSSAIAMVRAVKERTEGLRSGDGPGD